MDIASFVQDCPQGVQYRHYLTEWPDDSAELLQSRLSMSFLDIKEECTSWPAEDMYKLIAHHALRFHQESC
jgi:hypothetical protein